MKFSATVILRPIINKLVALQSFFFSRPRIDIDLTNTSHGQKSFGYSSTQISRDPVPISEAISDFEFHWNFKLHIKNNSSKTAYGIKIESIYKTNTDYLENMDNLLSLKEGEKIELDYIIRYRSSKNGQEAKEFLNSFPGHLDKIEIIISYSNEARTKYYTTFIATKDSQVNEHLLRQPKIDVH